MPFLTSVEVIVVSLVQDDPLPKIVTMQCQPSFETNHVNRGPTWVLTQFAILMTKDRAGLNLQIQFNGRISNNGAIAATPACLPWHPRASFKDCESFQEIGFWREQSVARRHLCVVEATPHDVVGLMLAMVGKATQFFEGLS